MNEIKIGRYQHFKGMEVEVIGIAKHSETLEEMVVYRHDGELWVRPKNMFLETVERDGQIIPRFKFIGSV
jgi:cyclomaltodextrinase / maltogenic alpha-amylase / neopullulanase